MCKAEKDIYWDALSREEVATSAYKDRKVIKVLMRQYLSEHVPEDRSVHHSDVTDYT